MTATAHNCTWPFLPSLFLIVSPLLAFACSGCGSRAGESESKMTSYTASERKADTAQRVQITQEQMAHVHVVPAQKENLPRTLRLTGAVAYNAFQTSPVFSAIGGPVHEILATPGQIVHKGQPLLLVTSPDYSVARSAYIKARDTYELSDKLFTRAKDLYAHGAIAEADLQQAESTHAQARADLESSSDALRALGLKDPESVAKNSTRSTAEVPVIAPVAGEIVERLVGPGQPALDATTRTLPARIVTQNPGKKLKKDMYVTATVRAAALRNVLTVPDDAVLRDSENEPFVYVLTAPTEFARRQVTLGESNHGRVQLKTGVKEGERVAANGSLFLQFMNSLQH
jgi:cobalt-zinc-cadmium efflux system membrane fusion protein